MSSTKGSKNNLANRGTKQPHVCRVKVYSGKGKPRMSVDQATCQAMGFHR